MPLTIEDGSYHINRLLQESKTSRMTHVIPQKEQDVSSSNVNDSATRPSFLTSRSNKYAMNNADKNDIASTSGDKSSAVTSKQGLREAGRPLSRSRPIIQKSKMSSQGKVSDRNSSFTKTKQQTHKELPVDIAYSQFKDFLEKAKDTLEKQVNGVRREAKEAKGHSLSHRGERGSYGPLHPIQEEFGRDKSSTVLSGQLANQRASLLFRIPQKGSKKPQ